MGITGNINDRKAAESLIGSMLELIQDDFKALPSRRSKLMFCQLAHDRFASKLEPLPPCTKNASVPVRQKLSNPKTTSDDVESALEICGHIEQMAEDIPSAGWGFASDVIDQMNDMRNSIIESNRVTPNQLRALGNWECGLSKWIRD